jgi:hypothetical protein
VRPEVFGFVCEKLDFSVGVEKKNRVEPRAPLLNKNKTSPSYGGSFIILFPLQPEICLLVIYRNTTVQYGTRLNVAMKVPTGNYMPPKTFGLSGHS